MQTIRDYRILSPKYTSTAPSLSKAQGSFQKRNGKRIRKQFLLNTTGHLQKWTHSSYNSKHKPSMILNQTNSVLEMRDSHEVTYLPEELVVIDSWWEVDSAFPLLLTLVGQPYTSGKLHALADMSLTKSIGWTETRRAQIRVGRYGEEHLHGIGERVNMVKAHYMIVSMN